MKRETKIVLVVVLAVICALSGVLSACQPLTDSGNQSPSYNKNTKSQYSDGNVPMTDLASTYKGNATDSDGNLLAPFDVVYPEHFASGKYDYDKTAALLKFAKGYDGSVTSDLKDCGFVSVKKVSTNADGSMWYRATIATDGDINVSVKKARSVNKILMVDYDYIYTSESVEESVADVSSSSSDGQTTTDGLIDDVLNNIQVKDQWYLTSCSIQKAWRFLQSKGISAGGSPSVTVAVIDTGVDYTHPDLKANMWVNDGEIPGNGIDDDGDGYIDDVYGCSTVSDARFHSGDPMDDHGHGTHVAGIIAAANNRVGTVGVAYNTKIMAIKAGQATGVFLQSDIAEAVTYAYTHGADVINMSFGGSACSIAVQDALQQAYTTSTLVAAAGNNGVPNEATDNFMQDYLPSYPAALSYVVGVMSVNAFGVESAFTNWDVIKFNSAEYEVYAPGEVMLSTLPDGRYGKLNGTSMAAPVVSGVAALLRSYYTDRDMYPSKFIAAQLCSASGDVATCFDLEKHGIHNLPMIVNAYDALTKLPKPKLSVYDCYSSDRKELSETNNENLIVDAGETIQITPILRNHWGQCKNTKVYIDSVGSLGIENPYVEILCGVTDYGSVGTYSIKDLLNRNDKGVVVGSESTLLIKISDSCPNNYYVKINLRIEYENGLDDSDKNNYKFEGSVSYVVRNAQLIPTRIDQDLTLTKDKYYMSMGMYIYEGVTVKIEPGVTIEFYSEELKDAYSGSRYEPIVVRGQLQIEGTVDDPVNLVLAESFKKLSLRIQSKQNGVINARYANIENVRVEAFANSLMPNFERCVFTDEGSLPYIQNANLTQCKFYKWSGMMDYCNFDDCAFVDSHAISSCQTGDNVFTNCVFDAETKSTSIYLSSPSIPTVSAVKESDDKYVLTMKTGFDGNHGGYYETCMRELASLMKGHLVSYKADSLTATFEVEVSKNEWGTLSTKDSSAKVKQLLEDNNYDLKYFSGNAILNDFGWGDISRLRQVIATSGDVDLPGINADNNYWDTVDTKLINAIVDDFDDNSSKAWIKRDIILKTAPETSFPFVTDAYIVNSGGERTQTVSREMVKFVVEFNRDMDTTVPLNVRFGSSLPYGDYEVEGRYVSDRRWEGAYEIKAIVSDGIQRISITNGHTKNDAFFTLCSGVRFGFEIDTTAAQAMIMQGEATETGVNLTWQQDDFDTLLGYNVYRSDKEDGLYTRLNSYVLAADETSFFDNTVEPGKLYYYNFTVVKTDLEESTPSGKIVIRAMDTMAPDIYHSPVRTAYTGKNLVVSATITDNLQIAEARLYYRIKDGEWKSVVMYNNNSRYYGIVGAEYITTEGLEYYIDATDGVTHTYNGSADNPYFVTVKVAVDLNSMGDVDGDGVITNKDALMLLQAANDLLNLTEEQFMRADLNGDGELSAVEAMKILQYVSGKITSVLD